MKIKVKATPKPRNPLVAAARLRGGAGAHQSEACRARRAGPASTGCSNGWRAG